MKLQSTFFSTHGVFLYSFHISLLVFKKLLKILQKAPLLLLHFFFDSPCICLSVSLLALPPLSLSIYIYIYLLRKSTLKNTNVDETAAK